MGTQRLLGTERTAIVFTGGPSLKVVDFEAALASVGERPLVITVKNAFDMVPISVDVHFFNDTNLRLQKKKSPHTKFVFVSSRYFSKYFVSRDEYYEVRRHFHNGVYQTAINAGCLSWLRIDGKWVTSGPGIIHTLVLPWLVREKFTKVVIYGWDNVKDPEEGGHADRAKASGLKRNPLSLDGFLRKILKPVVEAIFLLPNILNYRSGKMIYIRPPAEGEYQAIYQSAEATKEWLRSLGVSLEIR